MSDPNDIVVRIRSGEDGLEYAAADEIELLRSILKRAVDLYGKPGGPWNVPSDPGGWISDARAALPLQCTRER